MFGWLKDRFTNTGRLEKATRNAKAAADKFGTTNSREAAKKIALDLDASAATTKLALEVAEKNLMSVKNRCSSENEIATDQVRQARNAHNKVKDTTFQRIQRFATLGRAGWGATRSSAVNLKYKQLENAATRKKAALQEIARKQNAALAAEAEALKRRRALIDSALDTAESAADAAKKGVLTDISNFKPANNKAKLNNFLKENNNKNNTAKGNNTSRPGTPSQAGGRRRGRGRTHRRR
jgi:hypothetical protein